MIPVMILVMIPVMIPVMFPVMTPVMDSYDDSCYSCYVFLLWLSCDLQLWFYTLGLLWHEI